MSLNDNYKWDANFAKDRNNKYSIWFDPLEV